jgi:hypothetical protein
MQVYGGAISAMIGSYVWSQIGFGDSNATAADTLCSNCGVAMSGVSITSSATRSITTGNVCCPFSVVIVVYCFFYFVLVFSWAFQTRTCDFLTNFCSGSSSGSFVRATRHRMRAYTSFIYIHTNIRTYT